MQQSNNIDNMNSQALNQPLVMVVDDDPMVGTVLAKALSRNGYSVEFFQSGLEALEKFDQTPADMLVVDWLMPGLDGLSLIDALKDKRPSIPAMLITSDGNNKAVKAASASGRVDAVLTKPFNFDIFLSVVSALLKKNKPVDAERYIIGIEDQLFADSKVNYFHSDRILNSVIDAALLVNKEGEVIYYNRGADRMFGFKNRTNEKIMLGDVCPEDSNIRKTVGLYFSPHPPVEEQNEAFFNKIDGEHFYTIYSISLLDPAGADKAVVLMIKDINEHHIIERQISERARNLELLAITDPLTGIYNRRHFDRRLAEEFKRLERYNSPLTLLMLDFDHFKLINDFFGHLVGDQVLITAAQSLSDGLRDVDVLSRWGGEEFMIILPETGAETGLAVVKRLHSLIGNCPKWLELCPGMPISVSMGVVSLPWLTRKATVTSVLEALDQALYHAKSSGRNCIVNYRDTAGDFQVVK